MHFNENSQQEIVLTLAEVSPCTVVWPPDSSWSFEPSKRTHDAQIERSASSESLEWSLCLVPLLHEGAKRSRF